MDFGYGLQAADSFDKNQQQAVTADQQAQMFDWQKQKAESELENLPDKQAADKVGYQLKAAQGQSDLDVAPQVALIRKTLANTEVQNLPQTVMKMRTDSLMSTVDASHTLSAGLGKLIYDGAPDDQVVSYVNQSLQAQGKPGNVKRVGVSQNPNDPILSLSGQKLLDLKNSLHPGKTFAAPHDSTIVTTDSDGKVTSQTQVGGAPGKNGVDPKAGPLERDVRFTMGALSMTEPQAMEYLRQTKQKSRGQFITDSALAMTNMGKKPSQADLDSWGKLYDYANRQNGAAPPKSNSPAKPKVNPAVYGLTGVPAPTDE